MSSQHRPARSAEPASSSPATSAGDASRAGRRNHRATRAAYGPLIAPERPQTPDPWRAPLTAVERARDSQAPRLHASATWRPTRHGGVVELHAALWNGDHGRWVALTPHQARDLADRLRHLADCCEDRA